MNALLELVVILWAPKFLSACINDCSVWLNLYSLMGNCLSFGVINLQRESERGVSLAGHFIRHMHIGCSYVWSLKSVNSPDG